MKYVLYSLYLSLVFIQSRAAISAPFPNCLCGPLPDRAVADSVWYGTAGKKTGAKQEFTIREVLTGKERPSTINISIPEQQNFQSALEDGREYVVVIENQKTPSLVACQTVNVRPYYERRGRAFPGPNNPVECIGIGAKPRTSTTGKTIFIPSIGQKKIDWSFKLDRDHENNLPYFTVWKDTPGNGPRVSMTYGRQEELTTFKNGVAHGWMIERSSSGSVGWSGNYVDGKRDGVFTYYSDPREEEYRDGVLIKWKNDLRNIDPTTFKKDTSAHNRKQAIQKKPLRCENKGSESTTLIRVESKSNKELITKEFTCKAGLADGDHKTYNWLGTMLSHSDMKDGFLHGKVRIYNDGALDSVGEFVEGEQIGPVYVYSSTREDWGTFDPKLDPSVEMDWDSDVQVGKRVAKSVDETKKLWDMKSRIAFVGLSLDHRAQLVPSIAYGPMPCNYSREWSCDMSALRLSAFLGKRNGIAVDFTVGEYGVISDLLSVGARFDEEFGGGPMVSAEIGIAYFTLLLRGTWFVPKGRGEMDVGINFTYALKEKKRY